MNEKLTQAEDELVESAPIEFLRLMQARLAAEIAEREPPPGPAPEVQDGWRIVSAVSSMGLWDVIVRHKDGRVREFERCFFGANEPNMLAWCVEQIAAGDAREAHAEEMKKHEAQRKRLKLPARDAAVKSDEEAHDGD